MGAEKRGYTCADYRIEMILLMLHRRLNEENLAPEERAAVEEKIHALQVEMGLE